MGFRDISLFNQALLAKQSWRILRAPDSLLFKVLRGRYFRSGDFLNAPIGNNSSLTWKSIVWGRDLFKEGYRWVGNGKHVIINEDPWLSREGSRSPVVVPDRLKGRRVSELINPNGEWNEEEVRRNFIPSDAEDILTIPIGTPQSKDEIIWAIDSKGVFKVKSAYHLANKIQRAKEASGSNENAHAKGGNIWKLDIIPRAKICIWNILNNLIPTKMNLIARGLDINLCCSM